MALWNELTACPSFDWLSAQPVMNSKGRAPRSASFSSRPRGAGTTTYFTPYSSIIRAPAACAGMRR